MRFESVEDVMTSVPRAILMYCQELGWAMTATEAVEFKDLPWFKTARLAASRFIGRCLREPCEVGERGAEAVLFARVELAREPWAAEYWAKHEPSWLRPMVG